jgi:hypothetical protein
MTSALNSGLLTSAYHVFEKLKVIIMGDGYDVLNVLGQVVLLTFLLGPAKYK